MLEIKAYSVLFMLLILRLFGRNSREQLIDEFGRTSRSNKRLILDGELERQIKDLYEK